jgi:exportin-2 (importin alpha re-exporter)
MSQPPAEGFADVDRATVKSMVVPLMISVPEKLQLQLSEAVAIMAANDFPQNWDTLISVSLPVKTLRLPR